MFVSVSSQYYQAASIFIPSEEINFPLPDLYHVLSSLELGGLSNELKHPHSPKLEEDHCGDHHPMPMPRRYY
jgi:hypothetical protein